MMTPVFFYRTSLGKEAIREWLKSLSSSERKVLGSDLQLVQLGWKEGLIGEPLVKSLKDGLFEIRISLPSRRTARMLFCIYEASIALLHGFIKKTQNTPIDALKLARKRQRSLKQ